MDMKDMIAGLAAHVAKNANRKVYDQIVVPAQHIVPILELVESNRGKTDQKHRGDYALWSYISKNIPATVGKNCTLDTSNALRPMLQITSKGDGLPTVGKDGITEVLEIPDDRRYRLLELMDHEDDGPLQSYYLWDFLRGIFPNAIRDDNLDDWHLATRGERQFVIHKKAQGEE